jgi:hypothetical protein
MKSGEWFLNWFRTVAYDVSVAAVLLLRYVVLGWGVGLYLWMCWYRIFWSLSVWVVSSNDVMVVFTALIVCRVISAAQGAFCWRVSSLVAIFTVVGASAFNARLRFVAVCSCVSILLASYALRNVVLICSVRFSVDYLILDSREVVHVFVVVGRF